MYTNIIKKIDNRTLQTREIKKFPSFSEHTSYTLITSFGHNWPRRWRGSPPWLQITSTAHDWTRRQVNMNYREYRVVMMVALDDEIVVHLEYDEYNLLVLRYFGYYAILQ